MIFYSEVTPEIDFGTDEDVAAMRMKVRDNDLRTFIEASTSSVSVALGFESVIDVDAVLLLCQGNGEWNINSGTAKMVETSLYQRLLFDEPLGNINSLSVSVPSGGKIYEVYLLKKEFTITRDLRPMRYIRRLTDPRSSAYHSEGSEVISYSGLAPGGKAVIQIGWDYLLSKYYGERLVAETLRSRLSVVRKNNGMSKYLSADLNDDSLEELEMKYKVDYPDAKVPMLPAVAVDDFEKLFLGPPLKKPFFIYPEPLSNPNEAYRVYWANDFSPVPSASSLTSGYTLNLELYET